jgi:hypothetical protein
MLTNPHVEALPRKAARLIGLRTSITVDQNAMLDQIVRSTGISKAALVRDALAQYGEALGFMPEGTAATLTPTKTGGPGLASDRKESHHAHS